MKYLVGLVLILLLAAGGAWIVAGRMTPPAITIEKPEKFVGTATPLQIGITAPDAPAMKPIRIVFEQNGRAKPKSHRTVATRSASPTRLASRRCPTCSPVPRKLS